MNFSLWGWVYLMFSSFRWSGFRRARLFVSARGFVVQYSCGASQIASSPPRTVRGREYRSTNRSISRNNNRGRGKYKLVDGFVALVSSSLRRGYDCILWHTRICRQLMPTFRILYTGETVVVVCYAWLVIKLQYATPHSFSVEPSPPRYDHPPRTLLPLS